MKFTQSKSKICRLLSDKNPYFKKQTNGEQWGEGWGNKTIITVVIIYFFKLLFMSTALSGARRCDGASNGSAGSSRRSIRETPAWKSQPRGRKGKEDIWRRETRRLVNWWVVVQVDSFVRVIRQWFKRWSVAALPNWLHQRQRKVVN